MASAADYSQYDNVFTFRVPTGSYTTDGGLHKRLSKTIKRALTDRILDFDLTEHAGVFRLGLVLNPAECYRLVDRGPQADDTEGCATFEQFWGTKAELRRFKDSSIVAAVVWEDDVRSPKLGVQRTRIVECILAHALERHGVRLSPGPSVDALLAEPAIVRRRLYSTDCVLTRQFVEVREAFDALSRTLISLTDVPLGVTNVVAVAPALRYSSVFVPSPRRLRPPPAYFETLDIVLELTRSGRWPDDLEAIQQLKALFLERIRRSLVDSGAVHSASVVIDRGVPSASDNVSLEILGKDGFAWRARINHDRSLLLLGGGEGSGTDRAMPEHLTAPGAALLESYQRTFVYRARHHNAIATVQHRFSGFSPTVRTVKRWLGCQMLAMHFSDELIEIVVASVFLSADGPYERAPVSGVAGFVRVLELLSAWKWRDAPLIVPLYTHLLYASAGRVNVSDELVQEAYNQFDLVRREHAALDTFAWVVATEEDVSGTLWSGSTNRMVCKRVSALAKAALEIIGQRGLEIETLFTPNLQDYHLLIHLENAILARHYQVLNPDLELVNENLTAHEMRLDYDPVSHFVKYIQHVYKDSVRLFYAPGEKVIGGVLLIDPSKEITWTASLAIPSKPVPGNPKKVTFDAPAFASEIRNVGAGIVSHVELNM